MTFDCCFVQGRRGLLVYTNGVGTIRLGKVVWSVVGFKGVSVDCLFGSQMHITGSSSVF